MSIHVTHYRYDRLVHLWPQVVRLRPAPHCRTNILSYSLKIEPATHFINWQQDPFSNHLARLAFPEKTQQFKIAVDLVAEMAVYNPFDFFLEPEAETVPFVYAEDVKQDLAPYLAPAPLTPRLKALVESVRLQTASRSTRTRPGAGAWRASSGSATRRDEWWWRRPRPAWRSRSRSTCGAADPALRGRADGGV